MLFKGADIVGLKVITTEENKEVEDVDDMIYDPKENKLVGFLLSTGDVLTEPKVIPFKKVQDITSEALLIKSAKDIQPGSKVVKPLSSPDETDTYLHGTRVMTQDGQELGTASDIFFDTKSGIVQEFEVLGQSNEKRRIKISDVVTSTKDMTIIKSADDANSASQGDEGIMDKLKSKISGLTG